MDSVATPLADPADALPVAGPWAPLVDDLPTPTLSGWTPPPVQDVAEPERGSRPWGPIVGGSILAAAIAGLAVFNIFGVAGLAVAGGVAAAGTPAAAIGVSDFRRRMKTGRWRPTKTRGGFGRGAGRLGRTLSGGLGRRGGGRLGSGIRLGGGRLGGRRGAAGGGLAGGRPGRKGAAVGRLGRALSAAIPSRSRTSRDRAAASPRAGLLGRLRRQPAGMRGATARLLGNGFPASGARHHARARRNGLSRKRQMLTAMGLGHAPATRKQLRQARRAMRLNRRLDRRRRRHERRDHRRQQRRDRRVERRAVRADRRNARRARHVERARQARRALARPTRWVGRQMRRPFSAAWRRICRTRWAQAIRTLGVGTLLGIALAALGQKIRDLLRVPEPELPPTVVETPAPDAPAAAPAVARPGRTHRPAPPAVFQPPTPAPAVPTPRSQRHRRTRMSGTTMHPAHEAVVDAFREAIGGWEPPEEGAVEEYESFFGSWQEMFGEMGEIVRGLAERFRDDTPVETAHEVMEDVAAGLANMGDAGSEIYESWRNGNAADIERVEEPRPGERQMNVV